MAKARGEAAATALSPATPQGLAEEWRASHFPVLSLRDLKRLGIPGSGGSLPSLHPHCATASLKIDVNLLEKLEAAKEDAVARDSRKR